MSRALMIGMLMILAAVPGFYARDYRRYNEKPNQELACKAIVYSSVGGDALGDRTSWAYWWLGKKSPPDAVSYSGPASDNFALRISADGAGIFMLSYEDGRL